MLTALLPFRPVVDSQLEHMEGTKTFYASSEKGEGRKCSCLLGLSELKEACLCWNYLKWKQGGRGWGSGEVGEEQSSLLRTNGS